jgi:hypothetical protein
MGQIALVSMRPANGLYVKIKGLSRENTQQLIRRAAKALWFATWTIRCCPHPLKSFLYVCIAVVAIYGECNYRQWQLAVVAGCGCQCRGDMHNLQSCKGTVCFHH